MLCLDRLWSGVIKVWRWWHFPLRHAWSIGEGWADHSLPVLSLSPPPPFLLLLVLFWGDQVMRISFALLLILICKVQNLVLRDYSKCIPMHAHTHAPARTQAPAHTCILTVQYLIYTQLKVGSKQISVHWSSELRLLFPDEMYVSLPCFPDGSPHHEPAIHLLVTSLCSTIEL